MAVQKRRAARVRSQPGRKRTRRPSGRRDLNPSELPAARRADQPEFLEPQLATLAKEAPAGSNWLHEIKFDGYRIVALLRRGEVRLMTRRGQDWTARFPAIARAVRALPLEQAILDGELVILRPDGRSDFQAMQNALRGESGARLVYYLFDLPHCHGYDLTRTPLEQRKAFLQRVLADLAPEGPIRYSEHIVGEGRDVLRHACRLHMEGIICKEKTSGYESVRTRSWLKVKCSLRQEFVIGGYTDPAGARVGFGALLVGYYDENGRLRYCGKVGTGFNIQSLSRLHRQLSALQVKQSPFHNPPRGAAIRTAHWVRPELVAEIEFSEWTRDGHLRHPSFQGLREDKPPREVVREQKES